MTDIVNPELIIGTWAWWQARAKTEGWLTKAEMDAEAERLGWQRRETGVDSWSPPNDLSMDPEYFELMDKIDWNEAERIGWRKGEFTTGVQPREICLHGLQILLERAPKTYLASAARRAAGGIASKKGLLFPRDIIDLPKTEEIIEGILPAGSLSLLCAAPASGKSLLAQDWLFHLGTGQDWNGRKVRHGQGLWITGEGQNGLNPRMRAWAKHHGTDLSSLDAPLTYPSSVDITDEAQVSQVLNMLEELGNPLTGPYPKLPPLSLVVIDTLARCFGDGDENAAKDMTRFVEGCDRIRKATGATVLIVHHTGKDHTRGARGSSVLHAAVDVAMSLSKSGDVITLKSQKSKDGPEFDAISFRIAEVDLSADFGEPITSVVLEPAPSGAAVAPLKRTKTKPRSAWQKAALHIVNEKQPIRYGELRAALVEDGCAPRTAEKAIEALTDKGLIEKVDGAYQVVPCNRPN